MQTVLYNSNPSYIKARSEVRIREACNVEGAWASSGRPQPGFGERVCQPKLEPLVLKNNSLLLKDLLLVIFHHTPL